MSKLDDLAQTIGDLADEIEAGSTAAGAAGQEAEDTANAAEALGAEDVVTGMGQVKSQLETLAGTLKSASDQAAQIQGLTQAIASGG